MLSAICSAMTLAPRDYIAERRREIYQRMEALRAELRDLDRMESALADGPLMATKGTESAKTDDTATPERRRRRVIEGGIKSLIMEVLMQMEGETCMSAQSVLRQIKAQFGVDLPRTSLSPQLSRLHKDGMVSVNNSLWYATQKGRAAFKKN